MPDAEIAWRQLDGADYLPAPDSLWRKCPLPLAARYNIYGAPMTVATNAPALADLAQEVFGHWGSPLDSTSESDLSLRIFLHDVKEKPAYDRPQPLMRAQEGYLWISSGSSFGFADRPAGFATAFVTSALLSEPELLRSCFLECLGVYLACGQHRGTLHAAGLLSGDRGVLLTGRDGAGKSTLAYACVRAGFRLLAEDMVVVETEQEGLSAWGDARFLHLLPDAPRFFPEICAAPYVRQLNGETKLRVDVSALCAEGAITQIPVHGVCLLGRASGRAARLGSADADAIRDALTHFKGDPPVDHFVMNQRVDALLTLPTAHLEVGSDLDDAVAVLRRWVKNLRVETRG